MGIRISRAARSDVAQVLQILAENNLPLDGLHDHLATLLVARDDDAIVGSAALEVYGDGALLRSVAVASGSQGKGLGHQLTQAALDLARQNDVPAVYLLTTTAEPFFSKLGFERITREDVPADVQQSVEFKSACPASATVMRKGSAG